ncbi:MAG TPA: energy transducer TonB [Sphingomicrobium sp.]|nr:energy transducer TonB [Sphingomicrobium sp.]
MLAYAANAPRFADRRRSPKALMLIVGAHAVALAALMTAKMDIIPKDKDGIDVTFIDPIKPPPEPTPPPPPSSSTPSPQPPTVIDTVKPIVPINPIGPIAVDPPIDPTPIIPIAGGGTVVATNPIHEPVRVAPRFNTPDWLLRPPYPPSMQAREIEATLKLRLRIDDHGRVVAVDPVGRADPAFLEAARRHLIAKWRYKPATEDGRPVGSSTVITLRFELESA